MRVLLLGILFAPSLCAQNPSAILNLVSHDRGFLPPRMSEAERDAINVPEDGMIIYNTSELALNLYSDNEWQSLMTANRAVNPQQRLNINALSFRPTKSSVEWEVSPLVLSGKGFRILSPVNEYGYAHISLPVGTYLSGVEFSLVDESPTETLEVSIIYIGNGFQNPTTVASYQTNNGSVTTSVSVDHTMFPNASYYIRVHCNNWSQDMGIKGVRLTYELPTD